jgi:hypothetical protein
MWHVYRSGSSVSNLNCYRHRRITATPFISWDQTIKVTVTEKVYHKISFGRQSILSLTITMNQRAGIVCLVMLHFLISHIPNYALCTILGSVTGQVLDLLVHYMMVWMFYMAKNVSMSLFSPTFIRRRSEWHHKVHFWYHTVMERPSPYGFGLY